MGIKNRLIVMSFLQFFVWGAWLITIGNYWFGTKNWEGTQFGLVFGTMGIASLFMPTLTGIIADRWVNAEKLYCGFILVLALPVEFWQVLCRVLLRHLSCRICLKLRSLRALQF